MRRYCVLRIEVQKRALKILPKALGLYNLDKHTAKFEVMCRTNAKRNIYYTMCPQDENGMPMVKYADTYGLI